MSFKPITIPDAPYGADVAADTPELHNQKNALLRQAVSITGGSGILVQNTTAGIRIRARGGNFDKSVTILFGSPTATQGEYMGNIMDGQATGMPPAGMTVGQACVIENLLDASLSGIWPVTAGTYGIGRIAGSTTIAGTSYPVIHTQTPPPEDCT